MTCQWLFGDPTDRNFCGQPGTPWCSLHRKIVYRPPVELNTFGISQPVATQPKRGPGGSKPRTDSIAEKIRQASPDAPAKDLAEQFGCSVHHVRKVRRLAFGPVAPNKSAAIRTEIGKGLSNREIAEAVGCDKAYVRAIRYRMKEAIQ